MVHGAAQDAGLRDEPPRRGARGGPRGVLSFPARWQIAAELRSNAMQSCPAQIPQVRMLPHFLGETCAPHEFLAAQREAWQKSVFQWKSYLTGSNLDSTLLSRSPRVLRAAGEGEGDPALGEDGRGGGAGHRSARGFRALRAPGPASSQDSTRGCAS